MQRTCWRIWGTGQLTLSPNICVLSDSKLQDGSDPNALLDAAICKGNLVSDLP